MAGLTFLQLSPEADQSAREIQEPDRRRLVNTAVSLMTACVMLGASLVHAAPASAQNAGGAVAACYITMTWPTGDGGSATCGTGPAPFTVAGNGAGFAYGAFAPGGPLCLPKCTFQINVDDYHERCQFNQWPATGDASGSIQVNGQDLANFSLTRVGLVLVLVLEGGGRDRRSTTTNGAGVASFVPDITKPLPSCQVPEVLSAHVAGIAIAAQL